MEWLQWQQSPWGERTLLGLSWDVAWVALAAGVLSIAVHAALYHWRWRIAEAHAARRPGPDVSRLPERLLRHGRVSRIFHWAMALAVVVLLLTSFLPLMGIQFAWVTLHWAAGFTLTGIIVLHVLHTTLWRRVPLMWITRADLARGWSTVRCLFDPRLARARSGKYPLGNKLFHHAVAVTALATIVSGLVIMVKVETPWWSPNPYVLSDDAWGLVYLIHDAGAVLLIPLILMHVYLALRPEKLWITQSMFRGWIPRERYPERHDPLLWVTMGAASAFCPD